MRLPARADSLLVYGAVRATNGDPAASAVVRFVLARPAGASAGNLCEFDPTTSDADPAEVRTDANGRFRSHLYSIYEPATRCLRVSAHAAGAGAESASVEGLLVPFRVSRPDSVGIVMTLR